MYLNSNVNFFGFSKFRFSFLCLFLLVFSLFGGALEAQGFDRSKDILIAQFDNKPDADDIHAQAALASILTNSSSIGIKYFIVTGAYGKQSGKYIDSNSLLSKAYGPQNGLWTDANKDRAGSVTRIVAKVKPILLAGGKVWVAEAGQSDVTLLWINALIAQGVPAATIKSKVTVVQHSKWNEDNASAGVLTSVKLKATYLKIADGNVSGNGTPGYSSPDKSYMISAKSATNPNAKSKAFWTEADRIIKASGFNATYSNIPKGGVDFSDTVESWYILGLGAKGATISAFWASYVINGSSAAKIPAAIDLEENLVETSIKIYPNPVSSVLNINFSEAEMSKEIKIFNSVGQMVYSTKTVSDNAQINIQNLKIKGIAVVQILNGNKLSNHKIQIK